MPEELQGLLNKIHNEGIKEAEKEKSELISKAKEEASGIINNAKEEAENIKKEAKEEAEKDKKRSEETIRQAARDINLTLKTELEDRLKEIVKNSISEAMTPELMSDIIKKMVDYYKQENNEEPKLKLIFPPKELEKITNQLRSSLVKNLQNEPELFKGYDFSGGVKVGFKGEDVYIDFTDEALTELICEYVGPRLASTLKGE